MKKYAKCLYHVRKHNFREWQKKMICSFVCNTVKLYFYGL